MRLLDTTFLHMETFTSGAPPYAILSHRWLDDEIEFQDVLDWHKARNMAGFQKLKGGARIARSQGYKYIWIDTCCIDKSSSAELSEAINSMYRWYKEAAVCYAYLSDIDSDDPQDLSESRWFARGWTLQELIAPRKLLFYSASWSLIGSRDAPSISKMVQDITGVPLSILQGGSLRDVSAACKMSWASKRVTTRAEDMAYCLLGIFDVNMPLIYGEGGEKAFIRLQEEFLKTSDDESIFAWKTESYEEQLQKTRPYWGLLATSPAYFSKGDFIRRPIFKSRIHTHPINITNRGIRTELSLCPFQHDRSGTIFLALLRATTAGKAIAIVLQRLSDVEEEYVRVAPNLLIQISMNLFSIPMERLSTEWRRDYFRLKASQTISSSDTDREAWMRVADPESRLIFVRSSPPESELLAGFYLPEEIISAPAVGDSVQISGIKWPDIWWELSQPEGGSYHRARPYYMLDLLTAVPEYEELKAEMLTERKFVGGLEIGLACKNPGGSMTVDKTFSLLIGLEPLPANPFETPPRYIKPWYALVAREFEESWVPAIVGLGDAETLRAHILPNGCTLTARFTTGMRYEQLHYKVELVVTES